MMSHQMSRIQKNISSDAFIHLVSFTVDPGRDTPEVLSRYAARFGAKPERWTFLTGDPKVLDQLDFDAFHLGHLTATFDHSTRLVLIDQKSRIRGYYSVGMENLVDRIVEDARYLAKENS